MTNNLIFSSNNEKFFVKCSYTTNNDLTFWIKVKSGKFAGKSEFCIPKKKIIEIIETLTKINSELKGRSEIKDYDSVAAIKIIT